MTPRDGYTCEWVECLHARLYAFVFCGEMPDPAFALAVQFWWG